MARKLERTGNQECSSHENEKSVTANPSDCGKSLYSRRSYITLGASVAAVLPGATVATAQSSSVRRDGIEFRDVQNAVEDLGMDPSGRRPIDEALAGAGNGVLIQFPDGRYRFDGGLGGVELEGETCGFEGVGENVAFVVPEGYRGFSLNCEQMDGVYVDGIDIDQTAPDAYTGMRLCGNRVVVRDVELRGSCDVLTGGCPVFSHATPSAGGTSRFENVVARADSPVRPMLGRPGIFVERSHSGSVRIQGCDFRHFPDAAVYAAKHPGNVAVLDSYFENNAASIRLCGDGSSIERCDVVVDDTPASLSSDGVGQQGVGQQFLFHGISVTQASEKGTARVNPAPVTITDTTMRIENESIAGPALVVPSSGTPLEVVDCTIEYNNEGSAVILCRQPGTHAGSPIRPLRVRGTTISGNGLVDAAVVLGDIEESELRDTSILLPGATDDIHHLKSD